MQKPNFKKLNLGMFLSLVFIIASISIAVTKLTGLPPEYTMVTVALLFGAVGALQCINIQKRRDQLEALRESMEKLDLTTDND